MYIERKKKLFLNNVCSRSAQISTATEVIFNEVQQIRTALKTGPLTEPEQPYRVSSCAIVVQYISRCLSTSYSFLGIPRTRFCRPSSVTLPPVPRIDRHYAETRSSVKRKSGIFTSLCSVLRRVSLRDWFQSYAAHVP